MTKPIEGKVTNIIDEYRIAINVGRNQGVQKGMLFRIVGETMPVIDPDTQEQLGVLTYYKGRVKVTNVYDNYSLTEGYESVTRETLPFPSFISSKGMRAPLKVDETILPELDGTIRIGDVVREFKEIEEETS